MSFDPVLEISGIKKNENIIFERVKRGGFAGKYPTLQRIRH